MKIAQKAVDFVINTVKALDESIEIYLDTGLLHLFAYFFLVSFQGKQILLELDKSQMDDFDVAIEKYSETDYYRVLESSMKFRIYIELGSNGLLTDFEISSEIINEKEHRWKENRLGFNVSLDPWMYDVLNEGLKKLSAFLNKLLTEHKLNLPDIKAKKELIDNLIDYYRKYGHFSSEGVAVERLSLLKAAAVCEIMCKEKERVQSVIPIVKSERTKEIYEIVSTIREKPFRGIKMPAFIKDYYVANKDKKSSRVQDSQKDDLDKLLDKLDPNLKKKRIGAWTTFRSENQDRLSQSANSMVELLDKVIGQLSKGKDLSTYLKEKYGSEEAKWIEAQIKLITETKNKLHRVKHHVDYNDETIAEGLLSSAEIIMTTLLK